MKRSISERIFDNINIAIFLLACVTYIYPFMELITKSLSTETYIFSTLVRVFPDFKNIYTGNWNQIFSSVLMWRSFFLTTYVVVASSFLQLLLCAAYAYPLSKKYLPDRNVWTIILLITMYFGGGLIPTYLWMKTLGLIDNLLVLILGGVGAYNVLIIRNFFMTLPESLEESAEIEGANRVTIFFRIVIPLSKPVLATILLWNLVGGWNSWVGCLIYINDPSKQVLQLILRKLIFENTINVTSMNDPAVIQKLQQMDKAQVLTNEGIKAAAILFVIIPILITYPFLQKYFTKGILIGSLKG